MVKCQPSGELLWGVVVETEAYSQDDPACHGYRRRSPSNETLFGEPGRFYVYVSYGIHHCVKVGRIEGAGESPHAKWVEMTDADITAIPNNSKVIILILLCLVVMPVTILILLLNLKAHHTITKLLLPILGAPSS
ncbi:Putative 3-methyladenine DNA glycosylase [Synechococcus sp. CBW1107]|nr:Putative 3-methyladenine DNA glycosylase [Synechococcus sp. CBW1107]